MDNKSGEAISKQDLELINQRLRALEARVNKPENDGCDRTRLDKDIKPIVGFRDKVRRKPQKSSSFNERSPKQHRRSPHRHTVPSDRDETTRIEEFRTECISKAIKSNTVDIVNSYTRDENPIAFVLPNWLSEKEIKLVKRKIDIRYQCRTFLTLLREKRFDMVRQWIQEESGLEEMITNHIWKTFEEFNDSELILRRMCTFCKLKLKVDVSDITDHLCSIEMISDELYKEINTSDKKVGLQNELWLKVAKQCQEFPIQSYVMEALRIALTEIIERSRNEDEKIVVTEIMQKLTNVNGDTSDIFECKCKDICSRELQPMSLLQKMSLIDVYASPQAKRRAQINEKESKLRNERSKETATSSSTSSNESIASNLKMNDLCFPGNETFGSGSLDERFISMQNSNRNQFIKRRSRSRSKERKASSKARLNKKETHATPITNTIEIDQPNDIGGEGLNAMTGEDLTYPKYPFAKNQSTQASRETELDTTFSSDNDEYSAKYRNKTHEIIKRQVNAKEKRNFKINIINPAQVNFESSKSTVLSRGRHSAIESASD